MFNNTVWHRTPQTTSTRNCLTLRTRINVFILSFCYILPSSYCFFCKNFFQVRNQMHKIQAAKHNIWNYSTVLISYILNKKTGKLRRRYNQQTINTNGDESIILIMITEKRSNKNKFFIKNKLNLSRLIFIKIIFS